MSKVVSALAVIVAMYVLSYFVMTNAWGLTLQSPAWFIGGCTGHLVLMLVLEAIKKED